MNRTKISVLFLLMTTCLLPVRFAEPDSGICEKRKAAIRNLGKLICIAGMIIIGASIPERLTYSASDSVGYHLFFLKRIRNGSEIRKNEIVMFQQNVPKDFHLNCSPCRLLKKVGCVEGETLKIIGDQFFCMDGAEIVSLGRAKRFSKKGIPVESYKKSGIIPKGTFFAGAPHPDSYDSRYFGPVNREKVEAIAIPII